MAHEWDRGVLKASSWHGLEQVDATMATAADLISHGERSGAFPIALTTTPVLAFHGGQTLRSEHDRAIVADYAAHAPRIVGRVGGRYTPLAPADFRTLIHAACDAGAKPAGAFSLADGRRVLATFEVDRGQAGRAGEIVSHFSLCDSYDGTKKLQVIQSSTRVVCANTLAIARSEARGTMLEVRHTASIADKVPAMASAIDEAIKSGRAMREAFAERADRRLSRTETEALLDKLFPLADDRDSAHKRTQAENKRADAVRAMTLAVNDVGPTVATVQNAATWLVDRNADGTPRASRGGSDRLDNLIHGSRGQRIQEIETVIEVFMRDGSVKQVTASEALKTPGISPEVVGRAVLSDILGGDIWS